MITCKARVKKSNTARLSARVAKNVRAALTESANAIMEEAQRQAPVDTSSLQVSIYVAEHDHSGYQTAAEAAEQVNPGVKQFPEVTVDNENEAHIVVGVEHGIYLEKGTVRAPAQPFLEPATIVNERPFIRRMVKAVKDAQR